MDFRLLGPIEVTHEGRPVRLGGHRPRTLLAMLLLNVGEVVSTDRLIEVLWPARAPASADVTLRTHVAHLRRALAVVGGAAQLTTRAPGYGLLVDPDRVDACRFERLVGEGRRQLEAGWPGEASRLLGEALGLWRGHVLADLDRPAFAEAETARLEQLRVVALEERIEADLALGEHARLVGEVEHLVEAHPFRERLRGQLMRALYQSGRQAEALAVYRATRTLLADELGLTPGPALRTLEAQILRHDPELASGRARVRTRAGAAGSPGRPPGPSGPPVALLDVAQRGPLVAREAEMDLLRKRWRLVRSGGRGVVLVSGEAGVGKTRLVAELAQTAADEALLMVGHCEPSSLIAYQPVVEALRTSPDAVDAMAAVAPADRERLAALTGRAPVSGEPTGDRLALFEAILALVGRLAAAAPVVVVLEDLERIDQASSLLLRHLVGALPARVLMVLTFRDPPGTQHGPLRELVAELPRRATFDRVELRPFDEVAFTRLVEAVAGRLPSRPGLRALWQRTGGNAFYATELMRLEAGGPADDPGIPSSVRDVLRGRLEALSEPARLVLACVALIGGEVDFTVLGAVADMPEGPLVDAVAEASRSGFLVEAGRSWSATYRFSHALVREAVYGDIPVPQRQRLHLRAARALRASGTGTDVAAAAVHLRSAGPLADRQQAADLSLEAADAARGLYAWDEAAAHAEAALALLRNGSAPPERTAAVAERAGELRRFASADLRQAIDSFETALELYRLVGDERSAARVQGRLGVALTTHPTIMDIPRAFECFAAAEGVLTAGQGAWHVHDGIAWAACHALQTERIGLAADAAMRLADQAGRRDWWAWGLASRAYHHFNRADLATADEHLDRVWRTGLNTGDPHLGWLAARIGAFFGASYLGDPETAARWCRRGLALRRLDALARQRSDLLDLHGQACGLRGELGAAREVAGELTGDSVVGRLLHLWEGRWEDAERSWVSALRADTAAGDLLDATLNAAWLAGVLHLLDRDAEAVSTLERALAWTVAGPHVPGELMLRAALARLLPAIGELPAAARHLARCDEILDGRQDWRGRAGEVELARGTVANVRGEAALADAAWQAAQDVFRTHQRPWDELATLRAWAGSLAARGRGADAAAKLAAGHAILRSIGAGRRWHRHLDEVANRASGRSTVGPPAALSAREVEVLRLVAAGLSDLEIGQRLVLSPHTVHRHVANIRRKLGQPSRAAAVAEAARVGAI